ncbi:hypothetical protein GCM10009557_86100 [Virgisporangium ochraceum]|uniref:DUF6745 domain-containing protein n=2 Tax=Virgisporangium ochraceum TaxID=65505 RepID=A0A8J3ZS22_9ACTN|nr:hypothetical protein Voc01_018700 [Virgisporangium ochraceum]
MGRVRRLDEVQRQALPAHADVWVDRALGTDPVRWAAWESGARACYQYCGVGWPARVARVTSPLALARALDLAQVDETPGREHRALAGMIRDAVESRTERAIMNRFDPHVVAAVRREVFEPVDTALAPHAVALAVDDAVTGLLLSHAPARAQESARAAALAVSPVGRVRRANRRVPSDWRTWTLTLGGRWESAWTAYASFFSAVAADERERGWRRRVEKYSAAQSAGWWYPCLDFVLVSEPPVFVRTERVAGSPARLHCATGPAVGWSDGWALYFWHGTRVPAWVVDAPTVDAVHAEPNVEVRRCGIEALGWDTYIATAGLRLVDTAPDPGNPGFDLRLYDLPERVWGEPTRVLLATNGSAERDGTRRRYGLPVPADVPTAVSAAAWTYGLTGDQYARLYRRT